MGKAKEIPIWYICSQDLMKIAYEYGQQNLPTVNGAYKLLKELIMEEDIVGRVDKFSKDISCHFYQN